MFLFIDVIKNNIGLFVAPTFDDTNYGFALRTRHAGYQTEVGGRTQKDTRVLFESIRRKSRLYFSMFNFFFNQKG